MLVSSDLIVCCVCVSVCVFLCEREREMHDEDCMSFHAPSK